MKNNSTIIIGSQWGDEGKGKIVNFLSRNADAVVRYQGGNNAGHTIYLKGKKMALQHIPSGIFDKNTKNFIAQGCVINPIALQKEIKDLQSAGINCKNLYISEKAHVIMPYHMDIDARIEEIKSNSSGEKIGTTKKGIGPCYEDKYGRIGIRVFELIDNKLFKKSLDNSLLIKNKILKGLDLKTYSTEQIIKMYSDAAKFLKNMVTIVRLEVEKMIEEGKRVIFEGAQGVMLCIENGTYPFVTSSSPTSASAFLGSGVNPKLMNEVLSITKSYTTRVGEGGFPSEIHDVKIRDYIQQKGKEFGTVTGRRRRIGWLDTVLLNHSYNICGTTGIALTLLDVLGEIEKIKICVAYELDGKKITYMPSSHSQIKKLKPIYITLPGWTEDISSVKKYADLPENAKKYIAKLEELTKRPVKIVSVGPNQQQTFERNREAKW